MDALSTVVQQLALDAHRAAGLAGRQRAALYQDITVRWALLFVRLAEWQRDTYEVLAVIRMLDAETANNAGMLRELGTKFGNVSRCLEWAEKSAEISRDETRTHAAQPVKGLRQYVAQKVERFSGLASDADAVESRTLWGAQADVARTIMVQIDGVLIAMEEA